MRLLTSKAGYLLVYFHQIDESQNGIKSSSLSKILIVIHEVVANRGKIKGHLPLELIFGICRTYEEINKGFGFLLNLKTADI